MVIKNNKQAQEHRHFVAVNAVMNFDKKIVRNDTLQERDYLVVPMVMMLEGVHSGSEGPYLYTSEELSKRVELWNRKPVVVYHPDGPTACTKDILNTRGIGDIMNAKWDKNGKRLLAEAWLEEERVKKVDGRILEAIENEETLELSTGLFADSDEVAGEFNGIEFNGTLTNYGPDHLAILPDQEGACSIEDGAGFYRNDKGQKIILSKSWMKHFNELSFNTIRGQLETAIATKDEYRYVEDVFDSTFVWSSDAGMWEQDYKVEKNNVIVSGIPVAVVRKLTYEPLKNKSKVKKVRRITMDKDKLVENLTSNVTSQWEEDDRDYLMDLDEGRLQSMQPKKNQNTDVQNTETQGNDDTNGDVTAQNATTAEAKTPREPLSEDEYKAQMPASIRNRMERLERMEQAEADRLTAIITKNPKNTFTEEWLKTQDIEMLQNLANIATEETEDNKPNIARFNYGMGGSPHQNEKKDNSDVPILNAPGDTDKAKKTKVA